MTVKAGGLNGTDYGDSMAATIEAEFIEAWRAVYGRGLPAAGSRQRRIFFVAIARGVLRYLEEHQNDLIRSMRLEDAGESWHRDYTVPLTDLDIEL